MHCNQRYSGAIILQEARAAAAEKRAAALAAAESAAAAEAAQQDADYEVEISGGYIVDDSKYAICTIVQIVRCMYSSAHRALYVQRFALCAVCTAVRIVRCMYSGAHRALYVQSVDCALRPKQKMKLELVN